MSSTASLRQRCAGKPDVESLSGLLTCTDFKQQLKGLAILQSMSRKGNCWDNAIAESFFKILKTELIYHAYYSSKQQARLAIFEYIESWYNRKEGMLQWEIKVLCSISPI